MDRVVFPAVLLIAFLSGCTSNVSVPKPIEDVYVAAPPLAEMLGSGTDCIQASAVLAYATGQDFRAFVREDIRADFPDAMVGTLGHPTTGPMWGSYVSVAKCSSADGDLLIGWTAVRVLPPEWDLDGVERHYWITHLFFGDHETSHKLGERLGTHVDPIMNALIEQVSGNTYRYAFQTGTSMGDYDAALEVPLQERVPPSTTRLWAFHEGERGTDHYNSIDIVDTLEPDLWLGASGYGSALHWNNDLHGPAIAGINWSFAGQGSWSEAYEGFSREVRLGPSHSQP